MGNKNCFVDTSMFIALNNPNDQYHKEALEIAKRLEHYQFALSDSVITETYTLLRYKLGFHRARVFLASVLENETFTILNASQSVRIETLQLLEKNNDQKISYCDALSVALMNEHKIQSILSFDHHFEIMGVERFFANG